jgi:hypothetical protein
LKPLQLGPVALIRFRELHLQAMRAHLIRPECRERLDILLPNAGYKRAANPVFHDPAVELRRQSTKTADVPTQAIKDVPPSSSFATMLGLAFGGPPAQIGNIHLGGECSECGACTENAL